jgi:histidine triad (HIT) family protein
MGRGRIRECIRRAQAAEVAGQLDEALRELEDAARLHLERNEEGRAAVLVRHGLRLRPGHPALQALLERVGAAEEPLLPDEPLDVIEAGPGLPASGPAGRIPDEPLKVVEVEGGEGAAEPAPLPGGRGLELPQRGPVLAEASGDHWCSFCCRPKAEAGAMVAGPAGAYLCAKCLTAAADLLGVAPRAGAAPAPEVPPPAARSAARRRRRPPSPAPRSTSSRPPWCSPSGWAGGSEVRALSADEVRRRCASSRSWAMADKCAFCAIASGEAKAAIVYEDEQTLAFLDNRPLFPGHVLVIPRAHVANLLELPPEQSPALVGAAQKVARALEAALGCQGSFWRPTTRSARARAPAPARRPANEGDGLKGFFWPRRPYRDAAYEEESVPGSQRRFRPRNDVASTTMPARRAPGSDNRVVGTGASGRGRRQGSEASERGWPAPPQAAGAPGRGQEALGLQLHLADALAGDAPALADLLEGAGGVRVRRSCRMSQPSSPRRFLTRCSASRTSSS